ncbi:MAG: hypothetical protein ACYDGN_12265 [Acidimicrobiales bacterium]
MKSSQRADLAALFERHNAKGPREVKRRLRLYAGWDTLLWSHLSCSCSEAAPAIE